MAWAINWLFDLVPPMRLLNHTLLYLSGSLILILSIWAVIFYFNMMDEVYDSLDDGLENYKMLIIQKASEDPTLLQKHDFDESNYAIRPISKPEALAAREQFVDTAMYMQFEQDHETVRMLTTYFTTRDGQYYQLKIIASMIEEDDLVEDLLAGLLWLYVAVIASTFIINNWLLRKIWKPFYQLQFELQHFKLGEHRDFAPPATKVKEFKDLNETVVTLLEENMEAYRSQKQFIENASHELQTPLAIAMNKLELLLEKQDGDEEQVRLLVSAIQHLERLTRLNKSLLLLSKIENRQFTDGRSVDFNALFHQQIDDFNELLAYKNIRMEIREEGKLCKPFNIDLANILIANLLKNAIVHNHEGGSIHATIYDDHFIIANTGAPQSLDEDRLFSRFYKSGDHNKSTGLGLSIVKAIAQLHRATIEYGYSGEMHRFVFRKG